MKKLILILLAVSSLPLSAQFTVTVKSDPSYKASEAYFYTLNGSKDILISREQKKGDRWQFKYPKAYSGMMKVYFPDSKSSVNFISENKDVSFSIVNDGLKVKEVNYEDQPNKIMDEVQAVQRNREVILPALYQMKEYYRPNSEFGKAMDKEILALSAVKTIDAGVNPFVAFYNSSYNRYLVQAPGSQKPANDELINLFSRSDDMLESSSLLRPLLTEYLKNAGTDADGAVEKLLKAVNVESPRGQTILSELIELFDTYGMAAQKEKYLSQAKNLKCTVFDRLASTIQANKNSEIGSVFPNYKFVQPVNTSAKTLYDVKFSKKIIVFWSSTCSHCETELPQLIPYYKDLKAKGIEIVGLSLDNDKAAYQAAIKNYPWINDSELHGWYSTFAETYNVHATPSYFILDSNHKIISKPDHVGDVLAELALK